MDESRLRSIAQLQAFLSATAQVAFSAQATSDPNNADRNAHCHRAPTLKNKLDATQVVLELAQLIFQMSSLFLHIRISHCQRGHVDNAAHRD
jgi:hypothetical protein